MDAANAVSAPPGLTGRFCKSLAAIDLKGLGYAVESGARQVILDGIAVAVAGAVEQGPRLLRQALQGTTEGICSVIGHGRSDPLTAARLNGAAMHVLDFEPMWSPANHATSTTLSAVLAAAELSRADGAQVLLGFVRGVEAQGRLRRASGMIEPRAFWFHPPGQVGPIGAAIGAASVFGLSAGQMAHAVGIAASTCGGLMANVGSMTKSLHCGNAASNGLMAAMLAREGFTANGDVLAAPSGYVGSLAPKLDENEVLGRGHPLCIEDPGYAIKMFPSQYGTHFGITAALQAVAQVGSTSDIVAVEIHSPEMPYIDRPRPRTGLEGKFSFQFTVAAALLDRKVTIDTFTDARLASDDMQHMLLRIALKPDSLAGVNFENMCVRVAVTLANGEVVVSECRAPRGYLRKGARLEDHEVAAKAADCLARALPPDRIAAVVEAARRIDALTHEELAHLLGLLTTPCPN